ncbi:MAG: glycosyltransferase family 4 protein [Bacteroidota bacterium]|nr:glycosyltransferase family 4 protein [Bacteroidota bacterium]
MRILLLNHYYWPDVSGNAQYGTQLAEDLAAAGMEVHAIASRGDYLGERQEPLPSEESRNGVSIHRIPVTNLGKKTPWQRIGDAMSFHLMAFLRALRLPKPDVIVAQTAPLLAVTPAAVLAMLRRSRLVIWCQDVWPDIAFALNLFRKKSFSGRIFRTISYASMRRADRVVAIGRCMHEYLVQRVRLRPERIVLQQNWGDSIHLAPVPREENGFRRRLGLAGKLVILYSGNMGWGHPFESIMEVARRLREDDRVRFLFIGGGQRRPFIENYLETHRLTNAVLLPYQPGEALAESLSAGDIHLISLDERLDGLIVPSKLYAALAVGRPVVFLGSAHNEVAYVLEECRCGVRIDPVDVDGLERTIREAVENPGRWDEMGRRGYEHFRPKYSRETGTASFVRILRSLDGR